MLLVFLFFSFFTARVHALMRARERREGVVKVPEYDRLQVLSGYIYELHEGNLSAT